MYLNKWNTVLNVILNLQLRLFLVRAQKKLFLNFLTVYSTYEYVGLLP